MVTRLRGVVLNTDGRTPIGSVHVEAYDPGTGFTQGDATTDVNGGFTLSGLEDRTWIARLITGSASRSLQLVKENWVEDEPHAQRTTLSAHGFGEIRGNLGADKGGTGIGSPASGVLLLGAGAAASAMTPLAPGAASAFVRSDGSAWARSTIQAGDVPSLGANPSVSVGLTATNGSASTYLRSDGAPALSQAIAPTWTQPHTHSLGSTPSEAIVLDQTRVGAGINNSHMIRLRVAASDGTPHTADFRLQAISLVNDCQGAIFVISGRRDGDGYKNLLKLALPSGGGGAKVQLGDEGGAFLGLNDVDGRAVLQLDADNYVRLEVGVAGLTISPVTTDGSIVGDVFVNGGLRVNQSNTNDDREQLAVVGAPAQSVPIQSWYLDGGFGPAILASSIQADGHFDAGTLPITNLLDPVDPQDADTKAAREAAIAAVLFPAASAGYLLWSDPSATTPGPDTGDTLAATVSGRACAFTLGDTGHGLTFAPGGTDVYTSVFLALVY